MVTEDTIGLMLAASVDDEQVSVSRGCEIMYLRPT